MKLIDADFDKRGLYQENIPHYEENQLEYKEIRHYLVWRSKVWKGKKMKRKNLVKSKRLTLKLA